MKEKEYNLNISELIDRAKNGDGQATEKIVNENVGLIHSIVKRFYGRGYESEDLFQIGAIGLIKAIKRFDTSYNVKFSTYAVPMIIGEIKRFIRDDGIIKISRSIKETAMKALHIKEILLQENGDEPTVSEIAERLGISPEEIAVALEAVNRPESIYSTVDNGKNESKALVDKIESPVNYEEDTVDRIVIKNILNDFTEREQKIIIMRYFKQKTQSQIAQVLGISQVQVSRIEKKVLSQMRQKLDM